jgi:hypothetical protein
MKMYENIEEMFADLERRLEEGRRSAKTHHIKVGDLRHGDYFAYRHPVGVLVFGRVIEKTEYSEDDESIQEARENGFVFARCFSAMCPEGELGDTHVTRITHKVSKKLFDRAQVNGFRHLDQLN